MVVEDIVHGRVVFQNAELDDLIIARSDGTPTYNFCVVVDDMDMRITHVIRGDDHLNNTPRQQNMLLALGRKPPVYAHLPMILGADGAKLSKRHGAVSVSQYRDEGFLPEALLNYLVRLGWSHGDQEIFLDRRNGPAVRHRRRQQVRLGIQRRKARLAQPAAHDARARRRGSSRRCGGNCSSGGIEANDDAQLEQIALAQRERAKTLKEMAANSVFFFRAPAAYDDKAVRKHVTAGHSRAVARSSRRRSIDRTTGPAGAIHGLISEHCGGARLAARQTGPTLAPRGLRRARYRRRSMRRSAILGRDETVIAPAVGLEDLDGAAVARIQCVARSFS